MAHNDNEDGPKRLRSRRWFDTPSDPAMTALYLERYMNFGLTRAELQTGRPIIGIAQTGSDLSPCNRHHLELANRVRDGIREMGGVPARIPVPPHSGNRQAPHRRAGRNLAYLSLVEVLHGYPLDGVVLTTGCDKTTPACLMGAATVNIPAIVLSGGPHAGRLVQGQARGLRHRRLACPQAAGRRRDRIRGIHADGGRFRPLRRPIANTWARRVR